MSRGDGRCSRLWCGHVLTASQGSGTLVEFGSGFAKRKIEEGPVSPDRWFVLSTRPRADRGEKAAHGQEIQNLLENYRQTLTEYHSPIPLSKEKNY